MTPEEIAEALFKARMMGWKWEWHRADLARILVESCTEAELRDVCSEIVGTSHRNVARWADKSRRFPPEVRDPIYSPRFHSAHIEEET